LGNREDWEGRGERKGKNGRKGRGREEEMKRGEERRGRALSGRLCLPEKKKMNRAKEWMVEERIGSVGE